MNVGINYKRTDYSKYRVENFEFYRIPVQGESNDQETPYRIKFDWFQEPNHGSYIKVRYSHGTWNHEASFLTLTNVNLHE